MGDLEHDRMIWFCWMQTGARWPFMAESYLDFCDLATRCFRWYTRDPHPGEDLRLWVMLRKRPLEGGWSEQKWTKLSGEGFSPDPERRRLQVAEAAKYLWFEAVRIDRGEAEKPYGGMELKGVV